MAPSSTQRRLRNCRSCSTALAAMAAGWLAWHHCVCRPRFLRGVVVHAVWCELQKGGGGWAKQRLLLSTDLTLLAFEVVEAYANRWTVEPLFAAQAHPRRGRDVVAKPDGPAALASPGPDRPRRAGPTHRQGRTRDPRIGPA